MRNNINVIIINDFAHVNGGAGEVAISSAIELSNQGFNVFFFSAVLPVDDKLKESEIEVICLRQDYIVEDPNPLRAAIQGIWNAKAQSELEKLLIRLGPENTIVHIHGWGKSLSSSIFKPIIKTGAISVITSHSYEIACPNGGFYNFKKNKICKLEAMSKDCILCNCDKQSYVHKLWRVARQKVQQEFAELSTAQHSYIFISDFSQKILSPYISEDAKIFKLKNPINVEFEKESDPHLNQYYTQVGRIEFLKGPHLLAEAGSKAGVAIKYIGKGDLSDKIHQLSKNTIITGWLDKEGVVEHLRSSRALVFPSLCYETQGLVVAEAAALGIPAIVPDNCAARDMVEDGITGLYFKGGDVRDLRLKIEMLKDDSLVKKMGKAAHRKFWDNPYTISSHVKDLINIYDSILSKAVN